MRELPGHLADLESDVPAQWLGFRSQSASREAEAWRSREGGGRGIGQGLPPASPLALDRLRAANSTKASS